MSLNKKTFVVLMSQCYVVKQMVNVIECTIELWMHLRGLLSIKKLESHSAMSSCDSYASFQPCASELVFCEVIDSNLGAKISLRFLDLQYNGMMEFFGKSRIGL